MSTDEGAVMGDNSGPPSIPAEREVVAVLQGARRRLRKERSFSDWYTTALAGVLILVGLISLVAFNPWAPSGCDGRWCSAGVEAVSVAVVFGFSLIVYSTGLLVGPISVNAAEAFWVFSSPIGRGPLMRRRKSGLVLRTALGGVAVGFAHSWLWSASPWWLLAFPLTAVTVMTVAMLHEGRRPRIKIATASCLAVGAVVAGVASASPLLIGATISSVVVPVSASLTTALALLLTARRAWSNSDTLPLPILRRVQGARDAVAGAVSAADSGLLLDVIWARLLANRSFVTTFRLKSTEWRAVLEAETRRCLRSPMLLIRTLFLVSAAVLASLFGLPGLLVGISLGTMVFTSLNMSTLRLYATSRGLARSLPQSAILVRFLLVLPTLLLILGLVFVLIFVAAFVPGAPPIPSGLAISTVAISGLAGGIRWTTAPPTQFSAGIVMTEMGPIHVSALANATRGVDAAVLLALPAVLGFNPLLSLTVSLIGLLWFLLRK